MSVMDEVAKINKDIERLKMQRARLQERLASDEEEKQRLLIEAERLGVKDTSKLSEFVEEQTRKFEKVKSQILKKIEEAGG
jgi:hypothetical protein